MSDYFRSRAWQNDKDTFVKVLFLIAKNIDSLSNEMKELRMLLESQSNQHSSSE